MATSAVATQASKLNFTKFYNVINGQLEMTRTTRCATNPWTLEDNPPVPVSDLADVDRAVKAANDARRGWAATPFAGRQKAIDEFADSVEALKDDFAAILVKESGKPLKIAINEVAQGVFFLREYAKVDEPGEVVEDKPGRKVVIRYTPIGVAVGIVPWNFPLFQAIAKAAPALLSGNAFILKASPFTPYSALKLAELGPRCFPTGVFQALSGNDDLGPWLTAHPGVGKVSSTGSTATGKRVMESCSKTLKRVTLELGGNDAAIVCEDVDIKAVAPKGRVVELWPDALLAELVAAVKTLSRGDGNEGDGFFGPLQNKLQFDKVKDLLEDIKSQNYRVATGPIGPCDSSNGYFLAPTIVDNSPDDSRIVNEEPFGPVLPVLKWKNETDVILRANDTPMGLGASVWTRDTRKASRITKQLNAGSVWVNTHLELQPNAPFGGHKQSGIGVENGSDGLKSYCNVQTLYFTDA